MDTAALPRYAEAVNAALLALGFVPAGLLVAQQSAKQYSLATYDVNGRRIEGAGWSELKTPTFQQSNRSMRNINGRVVPSESVQERVLFQSATERIVERTVQRYDYEGRPLPLEKLRIEGRKNRDGSESIVTTLSLQDLQGRTEVRERRSTNVVKSANGESSSTVVERLVAGGFEVVERVRAVESRGEGRLHRDTVVQRKDLNGRFQDSTREIIDRVKQPGVTTETKTAYEVIGGGSLQPAMQTVNRTRALGNNAEVEEIAIHTPWAAGKTAGGAPQLQLSEQWLVERKPGPGNTVVESSSVAKPTLDTPTRMSAYQKISETVCSGVCKSEEK
jgi:hypothetical protein